MTDSEGPKGPFGGLDLGGLLQSAKQMQQRMKDAQDQAASVQVEGSAGGGMVTCLANGKGQVLRITIEQSLMDSGDKEMVEDLTAAAVNQAHANAKAALQAEMSKVTGGLPIPGDLSSLLGD